MPVGAFVEESASRGGELGSANEEQVCLSLRGSAPFSQHTAVRWSLHINMQRFRGGLVFKVRGLCILMKSMLESNKKEDECVGRGTVHGEAWRTRSGSRLRV